MEDENIRLAANAAEKQRGRPFKPGESGNPEGKKPGTKNYITLIEEAIKKYETDKGKKLFDRLIERAFINDNVLLNVVKKFVPDKEKIEHSTDGPLEIEIKRVNVEDNS